MLARREFLAGASALGVVAAQGTGKVVDQSGHIDPRNYGARGDGHSDDTRAVADALSHAFRNGIPVYGGGAVFAVSGNLTFSRLADPWIKSLRLKQLSPADDRKTLYFFNCERIRIDRLQVDVGSSAARGYMNDSGGLWIDGGSHHRVRHVDAFGDGKNSLIAIWNTSKSLYASLWAHNAMYDAPEAKDDVVQGIYLLRNKHCVLQSPKVSNLHGNADRRFATRYSRGIVLGGNVRVTVADASVDEVDQGVDITGGDGNIQCTVVRAHCSRCNAVGVKLANSAVGCRVVDSIAERCGLMGFLASGSSAPDLRIKTENCDFVRCTSYDAGYNGFVDSAPHAGFRVERNRFDRTYPMGIRFIGCTAIDRQPAKTMEYGFYCNVDEVPGVRPNELIDCRSEGHIRGVKFGPWR